jgi:hypothetical protein
MGIQDREWYQEEVRKKLQRRDATHPVQPRRPNPPQFEEMAPPDVPGSSWHWSVKIIALGWAAFLVVMAIRYLGR